MLRSLSDSLLSASFSLLRQYDASSDVRPQPVTQKNEIGTVLNHGAHFFQMPYRVLPDSRHYPPS